MHDIRMKLGRLCRPPLLVRAARIGAQAYVRERALPRLFGPGHLPPTPSALSRLIALEAAEEQARRTRATGYRAARHVEVLIALIGEAQILADVPPAPQPKASGIPALRCVT
ncbi:DUF6477 family protein [Roseovarius autotrophicus]|uniref:DUF6477 family protein n=1 Tax=Roseovarius autotrophicus TaxID=2824121 RepID=UPI001A0928D4|nr:DUF6477 family protein [Roseovarius autotrophicus]MBE0452130.1 hypothetical protein [Roseovarius sp.]